MDLLRNWEAQGRDLVALRDFQRRIPLHWAAAAGQREVVEYLLGLGADPTALDELAVSPARLAVEHNRPEVLGLLLDACKGRLPEQGLLNKLFLQSAGNGSAEVATFLLKRGAAPDASDEHGRTGLHLAAGKGHLDVMLMLLGAGAHKDARDSEGETPLYCAALSGETAAVHILMAYGAAVNAANQWGGTPLHGACSAGDLEAVEALVAAGADVNAADESHLTPLYGAMCSGNDNLVRLLVAKGARHDLFTAAGVGDVAQLARLLKQDPQAVDSVDSAQGYTPLHYAAWHGRTEAVRLLLESGASVSAGEGKTETPLHLAFMKWHPEAARLLLEAGADPASRDGMYRPAVIMTVPAPDDNLVRLCFEGPAHLRPDDHLAIEALHGAGSHPLALPVLNYLLNLGVPQVDEEGYSALHAAAAAGNFSACRLLLARGADVNGRSDRGRTPLHSAAWGGNPNVVRLLLDAGTALEAPDDEGQRPLHCAARNGDEEAVALLLARGAEVKARDAEGRTPLHWAARTGSVPAAQALLENGAQADVVDAKGSTPLRTAEQNKKWGVVRLLKLREKGVSASEPAG
jgi:ankyrin repeat protein